jgi:hypothetical protein
MRFQIAVSFIIIPAQREYEDQIYADGLHFLYKSKAPLFIQGLPGQKYPNIKGGIYYSILKCYSGSGMKRSIIDRFVNWFLVRYHVWYTDM